VPLNRKRRIFRQGAGNSLRGAAFASRGVVAVSVAMVMLGAGGWLLTRPSEAPAQPPAISRLRAAAHEIAVVDGQTLRIGDRVVHLDGIEAPRRGETCVRPGGGVVDCGAASANALAALVQDATLDCTLEGHDPAGRSLARCRSERGGVGEAMVGSGWARVTRDDGRLAAEQARASMGKRGIWASP
jgi:endonuclease YncB( thermonuclease family)